MLRLRTALVVAVFALVCLCGQIFSEATDAAAATTRTETVNSHRSKNNDAGIHGGSTGTSVGRKGQGTPATAAERRTRELEARVGGGGEPTANSGTANARRLAGGKRSPADELDSELTCDPPNSNLVDGKCVYDCHETALPSNNTKFTCVCDTHHQSDGVDERGRVKCKKMRYEGTCANWFGNLPLSKWRKIFMFAEQYGNTPWALMDDNNCIRSELEAKGYQANCGVQHAESGYFQSCDGDCVEGKCKGHGDL